MIRAELSSDSYATALGVTVRSPSPVLALCKKLIEVSTYAPETRSTPTAAERYACGCSVSVKPRG